MRQRHQAKIKPRGKKANDNSNLQTDASNLIGAMIEAHKLDMEAKSKNELGINKLRMLKDVKTFCQNKTACECFVSADGLDAFDLWLTPLEGSILPNREIVESVFKILHELPVSIDNLQGSDIGKRVMSLANICKDKEKSLYNIIEPICSKWLSIVCCIEMDFSSILAQREEE